MSRQVNPCDKCIVRSMCTLACEEFKLYVEENIYLTCPNVTGSGIDLVCDYMISHKQFDLFHYCNVIKDYSGGLAKQWKTKELGDEYLRKYFR